MEKGVQNGITAFAIFCCSGRGVTLWTGGCLQMTQPPLSQQIQQLEKKWELCYFQERRERLN